MWYLENEDCFVNVFISAHQVDITEAHLQSIEEIHLMNFFCCLFRWGRLILVLNSWWKLFHTVGPGSLEPVNISMSSPLLQSINSSQ